jgi:phospholipase D1/2
VSGIASGVTLTWPTAASLKRLVKPLIVLAVIVGLVLVYRIPAVAQLIELDRMVAGARKLRESRLAALLVPLVFVGLCLAFVPVTVLRTTTVIAFGPFLGPLYAIIGGTIAALIAFEFGRHAGTGYLDRMEGARIQKFRAALKKRGVLAVIGVRVVPLGPFTMVNAACGAAGLKRSHFLIGTLIVMIPGLVVLAVVMYVIGG